MALFFFLLLSPVVSHALPDQPPMAFMGECDSLQCWISLSPHSGPSLVLHDDNADVWRHVSIENGGRYELLASSFDSCSASLMLLDSSDPRNPHVDICRMDLFSDASRLDPVVAQAFHCGRNDRFYAWAASSPNGRFCALVSLIAYVDKGYYAASATLFDARMQPLWSREFPVASLDDIFVTDDGSIVTLGFEHSDFFTAFSYSCIAPDTIASRTDTVAVGAVHDLQLVHADPQGALAVGTYVPSDIQSLDSLCGGVFSVAFNFVSGAAPVVSRHRFSPQDMAVLYNRNFTDTIHSSLADNVDIEGIFPMPYGAVVALSRSEDGFIGCSARLGLHLVAFHTDGTIRWTRNVRRYAPDCDIPAAIVAVDSSLFLFQNEHKRTLPLYTVEFSAREFSLSKKSNIAMYRLSHDGLISKSLIEKRTLSTLADAHLLAGRRILLFLAHGSHVATKSLIIDTQ